MSVPQFWKKNLKYLGVAFTSDGRQVEEVDTRIGKAGAAMQALHYLIVKLSIFNTIFVPILTNSH